MKLKSIIRPKTYLICFFVSLITIEVVAQHEKRRAIDKTFEVKEDYQLIINNKFGDVMITTWDKNEFRIHVEIIVSSKNESQSQKILDRIDIITTQKGRDIHFKTDIKSGGLSFMDNILISIDREDKEKTKKSYKTNYTIQMPAENYLKVTNKFGRVELDDRNGETHIKVEHGSLETKDIEGTSNIDISFSESQLGKLGESDIKIRHSDCSIDYAKKIFLDQDFSNIVLEAVDYIDLESKFGSVEINKAEKVKAKVEFSEFVIGELSKSFEMKSKFVKSFQIKQLKKEFELVHIIGEFGDYRISLEDGLNANFDIDLEFASLQMKATYEFQKQKKESFKEYYQGMLGDGDDTKIIKIESKHGDVQIRPN